MSTRSVAVLVSERARAVENIERLLREADAASMNLGDLADGYRAMVAELLGRWERQLKAIDCALKRLS